MPRDEPQGAAGHHLHWTPELIERFWRGAYARDLAPARVPRYTARHIAALLAQCVPAAAVAMTLGDRDFEYAAALLLAGLRVGRIDTGALLRGSVRQLAAHPGWIDNVPQGDANADVVLIPDILAQVMDDEVLPLLATARASLRPGGQLAVTVPNDEVLASALSLCPVSGALFHKDQHLRRYTAADLRALLECEGFLVTAVFEAQPDENGFQMLDREDWLALATAPRVKFGKGRTLLAIAVHQGPPHTGDVETAAGWLARRRAVASATAEAKLTDWEWTPERVGKFWSWLVETPLNSLSFGLLGGLSMLTALEPWLVPGGRHLDVGAGEGEMARIMAEAGYAVAALEPSEGRRRALTSKLGKSDAYIGGLEAIDGAVAGSFDVAMAFEVVEHVLTPDLPAFFATFDRALAPGGRMILSTPNREDLSGGAVVSPREGVVYHRWQHVRSFDRHSLTALLAEHGFAVEVAHEIDAAALASGSSPYAQLVLTGNVPVNLGNASTLLVIAHRAAEQPQPPRNPLGIESRIAPRIEAAPVPSIDAAPEATSIDGTSAATSIDMPPETTGIDMAPETTSIDNLPTEPVPQRGLRPQLDRLWPYVELLRPIVRRVLPRPVRHLIGRLLPYARSLRPLARRVLPFPVRRMLVQLVIAEEIEQAEEMEEVFARRPILLRDLPPILDAESFAGGPVILLNNSLAYGGAERQVVTTLKGLVARTDRALGLLCLRLGGGPEYDFFLPAMKDFSGIVRNTITAAEARATLASVPPAAWERVQSAIAWMPPDVREDIERLTADFMTLRPAVIHAWQDPTAIAAAYAARIAGVPRIIVAGRNVSARHFEFYRPYMQLAYREVASVPDVIMINNSEAGAADYVEWLGLENNRVGVLRNGVDTAAFAPPEPGARERLRAELGIPEGAPIVGSIIRFNEEKRPLLWVEAASLVAEARPDCHFVVLGAGPLHGEAHGLARRKGIADRVHLPGTSDQAATYLSLFDVFLLTSRKEGSPNVVLEASLAGVPVVATEGGGTAEAIDEGVTGLVVRNPDPDPAEIARRVLQVLDDPEWRERARAAGPGFVLQRFGLDRMLRETLALYGV